ncbi:MAG: cysteine desulfurase family protein [Firmicutes bacterium]|nr:cysteine desulfurase family protein [Bacillota bacterium]
MMVYLDNSATTRQYDEVTELMYKIAKEDFGNPSSLHSLGFEAGNYLFEARQTMEDCFYGNGSVIFTSSGTEADNMALVSTCRKMRRRGNKIITTKVEHPAILETCKRLQEDGFNVEYLDVDVDGYLEPQLLKAALDKDTILVSIMTVNNEVGTIEPVLPAYRTVQEFNKANGTNIIFHTDAVQAFGKIAMDDAPFDLISASAHKIHGPKGMGVLYMRKDLKLPAFITGGGQESGYRSSTENVPGIAGFGLAAKMATADLYNKMNRIGEVNEYLLRGLTSEISDVLVNGPEELGYTLYDHGKRCPSVLNLSFMGTRGEVLLHTLEQDKILVSTGSACASHKTGDSHVLQAMSMSHKEIEGAIRFSLSEFNTIEEMDYVIDRVKKAVERFRKLGSFR